jgi:four helix bundle protein
MFLQLGHTKLEVYKVSKEFVNECYKITRAFPNEEKFAMVQQIRRAALSVHLNIAEGCSRRTTAERLRFLEIARSSLVEVDAALEIAYKQSFITLDALQPLGDSIVKLFKLLSGMMRTEINN